MRLPRREPQQPKPGIAALNPKPETPVLLGGVIIRVTILVTYIGGLITSLVTTHESPSINQPPPVLHPRA